MGTFVHFILSLWIASHVGHAILSTLYERAPYTIVVPGIYAALVLLALGAWMRYPRAVRWCASIAIATTAVQAVFIWNREAFGALNGVVLTFDILGIVSSLLYLLFFYSSAREAYLERGTG
jgi:hypothetical protein